ncbi:MAG: MBL fold metallo-hydrolase [Pseudomonadales bacterium]
MSVDTTAQPSGVRRCAAIAALSAALVVLPVLAAEPDPFADVVVAPHRVSGSLYMLTGAGGNIGLSIGSDGTLLIDDQYAPLAERIQAAVDASGGGAPKLVLNTHFHGDHTGSNPFFGRTGTIIAHDNVRARLLDEDGFGAAGLPVVTYSDRISVHFNGDTIDVIHLPAGHTDGDSIIWFREANVLHMGDLFFNGQFPYIDTDSGGSVAGVIDNIDTVLSMIPDDIAIIPGHGPLARKPELAATLQMLRETRAAVIGALGSGRSIDEIVREGLDARWAAWGGGFINEERWIRILATSFAGSPGREG